MHDISLLVLVHPILINHAENNLTGEYLWLCACLRGFHNTSRFHITEMQNIKTHSTMIEFLQKPPMFVQHYLHTISKVKSSLVNNGCNMLFANVIHIWNKTCGKILSFRWIQFEQTGRHIFANTLSCRVCSQLYFKSNKENVIWTFSRSCFGDIKAETE